MSEVIYCLRKSVGSLSAGTRVKVLGQNRSEFTIDIDSGPNFTISSDLLVKLRPRTDLVPVKNKAVRRAEQHKAMAILNKLGYGTSNE